MGDRYTYISLIGLFIIIAWGVPDMLAGWRHQKVVLTTGASLIIAVLHDCFMAATGPLGKQHFALYPRHRGHSPQRHRP